MSHEQIPLSALSVEPSRRHRPTPPVHLWIDVVPRARFDAIDVAHSLRVSHGDVLAGCRKVLYTSHHTTAGFLDQSLSDRLLNRRERVDPYFETFRHLFPPGAGYRHDDLSSRRELSEEQRRLEPPNADAHLTFIGSGLRNCVTYRHRPDTPVYLMDLDGIYEGRSRTRRTSVVGYRHEDIVATEDIDIPVSAHSIDSINLMDARLGVVDRFRDLLARNTVELGRIDLTLAPAERSAAITVNEYETLLMRHDLTEVLKNPFRFMARQGRHVLQDPRSVATKSIGYARYDVVRILNQAMESFGLSGTAVERLVTRVLAPTARRRLQFKRSVSLAVATDDNGSVQPITGTYQSPILIQWAASRRRTRSIRLTLYRFS